MLKTVAINPTTGSGNTVLSNSPTITTPTLAGNVQLSTGNLVIGTSGKGIDFSATPGTGTSELFSDYEEGTWNPVLSDGTNNATMSALNGHYTKIGNTVFLRAYIYTTSLGAVSGNLRITGLPFAVATGTDKYSSAAIGFGDSLAVTAGQSLGAIFWPGASYMRLQVWGAATGSTIMQDTEWTANGEIMIQAQYQA